ncbi:MAG: hypothetical protein AABZ60_02275, partial [Planctomycetota bacterium]
HGDRIKTAQEKQRELPIKKKDTEFFLSQFHTGTVPIERQGHPIRLKVDKIRMPQGDFAKGSHKTIRIRP